MSTVEPIDIVPATPGIAAFPSGAAIAQHLDFTLVSESAPVKPGEYVVLYLAGMGALGDKAKNVTPQVVHVEGDPDHPINRGTLCPKGSSLMQDILNDRRLLKPAVRRPGSDRWEDIGWDQAIEEVARHIKMRRLSRPIPRAAPSTAAKGSPGTAVTPLCNLRRGIPGGRAALRCFHR